MTLFRPLGHNSRDQATNKWQKAKEHLPEWAERYPIHYRKTSVTTKETTGVYRRISFGPREQRADHICWHPERQNEVVAYFRILTEPDDYYIYSRCFPALLLGVAFLRSDMLTLESFTRQLNRILWSPLSHEYIEGRNDLKIFLDRVAAELKDEGMDHWLPTVQTHSRCRVLIRHSAWLSGKATDDVDQWEPYKGILPDHIGKLAWRLNTEYREACGSNSSSRVLPENSMEMFGQEVERLTPEQHEFIDSLWNKHFHTRSNPT